MELQLIEAYIPSKYLEKVDVGLKKFNYHSLWTSLEIENRVHIRILVRSIDTEEVLNYLENIATVLDGFEVFLIPVQSYITKRLPQKGEFADEDFHKLQRASRHELLVNIEKSSKITLTYTLLVILSAIVVTIGFIKNSEAVIIGAMVIAPMLGPVISIAFSSILGDYKLLSQSLVTLLFGITIVVFISILFSFLFPIPDTHSEFLLRTHVNFSDIILALASGTAGALSILNRLPGSLVGVMVAVALLPPTVVFGMTLGSRNWEEAFGSSLLLLVNITSILLSAVIVFSLSGIRPIKWEEMKRANTSRKRSILFISIIIILLIIAIVFGKKVDLV
ncbi:TIGR00341 family protein [Cytobacillus spongiae]|uniref:TIGR00341 family protein n=1 Tax=Cytobacillus spongiae TaxID=2901381 RepID=UPI001F406743|nr:TIGR00341 family protein [Cytobacillus spongiae]UII54240.1 TIGR00341 family protein [Cytobacillus spongiae]